MALLWQSRAWSAWRGRRIGAAAEARRQQALAALAQRALEGATSDDLIQCAATLVARELAVSHGAVFAWEPDERRLSVPAGVGWKAGVIGRTIVDLSAQPDLVAALRADEPLIIDGRDRAPRLTDVAVLHEHGVASGVSVVVTGRERPFGALAALADRRRRFRPREIALMQSVARVLAIAIAREYGERALFEEMQMSTVLAHVGREIMSCVEMPALLARLGELTRQSLRCDHSVTWLRRQGEESFRAVAADGLPADVWEALGSVVLPVEAVATAFTDFAERGTVRVDPPSQRHPVLGALLARSGIASALLVPLHKGDDVVGLQMCGHRDHGNTFTPENERLAHGIGQLASVGLMNARVVEELERASQLKSEFVSTMSHELRTPLNIIIGYTDMLQDAATPAEQAPLLSRVRRASQELLEMIDGTLNINRLAAGGDVPRFGPVSVAELWRELQHDFGALGRRAEVTLRWEPCDDLELCTDWRKLKIVLKNLIGNALKFTPAGDVVAACRREGAAWVFTIRDTGVGIPADALPHVFDMFRQADSSETRSYNGAGLGLYIVKSSLTQLGGTVRVQSVVGHGSTFQVTLPVEQPQQVASGRPRRDGAAIAPETATDEALVVARLPRAAAGASASAAVDDRPQGARQRLLFADDLSLNRLLMQRFVAREFPDVEVLEACDGEQAVAMFAEHHPDLVLLDLHMPQLDGWQAARRIRRLERGQEIPILALSVDASPLAEANAFRAGFEEFIAKPISDYSALKARLAHWLGHCGPRERSSGQVVADAACDASGRERGSVTAA